MKTAIIPIIQLLLLSSPVYADDLTGSWEYGNDIIDGFRIYEQTASGGVLVHDETDPTARFSNITVDFLGGECKTFYVTAYRGADESDPSNVSEYCNNNPVPAPTSFSIQLQQ